MLMPSIFNDNLFDDFFDFNYPTFRYDTTELMKTDIKEKGDSYILEMDLPGFKKDEIKVSLKDGYLTVSAAKGLDKDEKDKKGNYIRQERYAGAMSRSFYVGDDVTQEEIKAKYEDGILKLSIPKKSGEKVEAKNRIAIEG